MKRSLSFHPRSTSEEIAFQAVQLGAHQPHTATSCFGCGTVLLLSITPCPTLASPCILLTPHPLRPQVHLARCEHLAPASPAPHQRLSLADEAVFRAELNEAMVAWIKTESRGEYSGVDWSSIAHAIVSLVGGASRSCMRFFHRECYLQRYGHSFYRTTHCLLADYALRRPCAVLPSYRSAIVPPYASGTTSEAHH